MEITSKDDFVKGNNALTNKSVEWVVKEVESKLASWDGYYQLVIDLPDKPEFNRAADIVKEMYEKVGWIVSHYHGDQREPGHALIFKIKSIK